jgi:DNA-binding transcriptional LysR family regulator
MVMCASPHYLRQAEPIATLDDLATHSVMAYAWWSGGDEWQFEDALGKPVRVLTHPRLRTNSGDTCRAAALADQGVIYQPQFLVGEDLRTGRLLPVLPDLRGPEISVNVVYPTRKHLPGKVRAMVDFLVAAFQTPAWGWAASAAPMASRAAKPSSS